MKAPPLGEGFENLNLTTEQKRAVDVMIATRLIEFRKVLTRDFGLKVRPPTDSLDRYIEAHASQ